MACVISLRCGAERLASFDVTVSELVHVKAFCDKAIETLHTDGGRAAEEETAQESELERLKRENARLLADLLTASQMSEALPERNMANYDEEEVSALNEGSVALCLHLRETVARAIEQEQSGGG